MPQVDNSSFSALVQKHIQDLRTHPHIQQVIPMRPLVYKVVYWPQDLDSLYSEMVYNLKLTIPQAYPQKPPHLLFLDKIYHLNIHPNSGNVVMSILRDDWSPFLSLKTVISSLDEVLEDPDESHAATRDLLEEYQQDMSSYVENVKATLQQNVNRVEPDTKSIPVQSEEEVEEIVEEVIDVNDFNYDKLKKNLSEQKILIQDRSNEGSLKVNLEKVDRREYSFNQSNEAPQSPRSLKGQTSYDKINSPWQNCKGQGFSNLQSSHKKNNLASVNDQNSRAQYEAVVRQSRIMLNPSHPGSEFEGLKLNMLRCKELIKIFTQEISELEHSLEKSNGSKRLKKLFEDRCNKVEVMIVELFDLSEKIRIKLMDTVRKDFVKYK